MMDRTCAIFGVMKMGVTSNLSCYVRVSEQSVEVAEGSELFELKKKVKR
jgi:hypothetical protein